MTDRYHATLQFIDQYSNFLLIGHKEPDGDCVGSQLALASWLERRGKTAQLYSAGPFKRPEIVGLAERFTAVLPSTPPAHSAIIVLDCSSVERTGFELPKGLPLAFIDHHRGPSPEADHLCIDDRAPAVTYMVQLLIEASGQGLNSYEAEQLLFGLCTDTGFFRHLDASSGPVFAAVSRLIAAGASPKAAYYTMSGGKSVASRQLMGLALNRLEAHYDGRLLVTWLDLADQERYGLAARDSDLLYQLLMTVERMEAVVVLRQESPTHCTVGFRSMERIDVAAIAAGFGGGGHRLAAGLSIEAGLEGLKEGIIAAFAPAFAAGL